MESEAGILVKSRQRRFEAERQRPETLNQEREYVKVDPIDVRPGEPPERYRVTFLCCSITVIDLARNPIYGTQHQVEIYCHEDFPADVPWVRWEAPMGHPDIQRDEPKNVSQQENVVGRDDPCDLCEQMFKMVQYQCYTAVLSYPYPLGSEAAEWVRNYGEPPGIVVKRRRISVDNRRFCKPSTAEKGSKISVVASK